MRHTTRARAVLLLAAAWTCSTASGCGAGGHGLGRGGPGPGAPLAPSAAESDAGRAAHRPEGRAAAEVGASPQRSTRLGARFTLPMMGTVIEVALPEAQTAEASAGAVFEAFAAVDREMSEWRADSPLAEVNRRGAHEAVPVPPELYRLLERSLAFARATDGAFDPTWAALWGLWDFGADAPRPPDPAAVAARRALVGHAEVALDPARGTVRLGRPGMQLGLGAIAKGYALDRAASALRARGVDAFALSAGGQVTVFDASGRPLRVALRAPRGGADARLATLALVAREAPLSVATSGDYERFFVHGGVRYHHVLDPKTGAPSTAAQAATVVGPDGTTCDALSTALMVAGPRGLAWLTGELAAYEAVIVAADGSVHASDGFCALTAPPRLPACAPRAPPGEGRRTGHP